MILDRTDLGTIFVGAKDLGHYNFGWDRPRTLRLWVGKTWDTIIVGWTDLGHYDCGWDRPRTL